MKVFLFLLSCLTAIAQPTHRVERGLNVVKTWMDGAFTSEFRQTLSACTNLSQIERYCQQSGDWTQRMAVARYQGVGPMPLVDGYTVEWRDGMACTNAMDPDSGAWSVFQSGGNQGAMCVQNGTERTQIINCATLRAEWKTNSTFQHACPAQDDQTTMIFWFRTNAASSGLPWFIGSSCSLIPGQVKSLPFKTPIDCVWHFMGTDKCFGCGESCWLAGWPLSAASIKTSTMTASSYGRSLHLNFQGAPGVTYALQRSTNLRDWVTQSIHEPDNQGVLSVALPHPAGPTCYRVEAVRTSSMTEEETAEVVREIRKFNKP